jgi:spore maturation protein A
MAVTMLGIMSMWTGLIQVARSAGLLERFTELLQPALRFLFPDIPREHVVNEYLTANILANILGLGWAATPMGLKAMREFAVLEREKRGEGKPLVKATPEMCTFLVLNISSLQLIPVSVIAYRTQYGALNPAAVVVPGMIATIASTLAAVVFCKIMCRRK